MFNDIDEPLNSFGSLTFVSLKKQLCMWCFCLFFVKLLSLLAVI